MSKLDDIRHALELARQGGYDEVELLVEGVEFSATLGRHVAPTVPAVVQSEPPTQPEEKCAYVVSPHVGYFRQLSNPVAVGQTIEKGSVVAQVLALGISNDVESNVAGEVLEVLAVENQPLQFGQPIFKVRP
jgi:biotin carboxyl carrier protein